METPWQIRTEREARSLSSRRGEISLTTHAHRASAQERAGQDQADLAKDAWMCALSLIV
jgi:hypothetical protein